MAKRKVSEKQLANLAKGKKICAETAREYQEKSAIAQKENTKARKEIESFQISSNKALAPIQASSLKELAQRANDILHNPESTPAKIKLAMEILAFLRDSSGQKPTDKQELTGSIGVQKVFITEKEHNETLQHIKDVINEQ